MKTSRAYGQMRPPCGLRTDGDDKLYAYTLATGAYDSSKDITLHTDNGDPQGIWSDETTIWVADSGDDKLYAYALSDGTRQDGTGSTTDMEFSLHADNLDAAGIWSDGTTIWVANSSGSPRKVFAYKLSDGTSDTDKEFRPSYNPVGIWSQGTTMWVTNYVAIGVGNRSRGVQHRSEYRWNRGPQPRQKGDRQAIHTALRVRNHPGGHLVGRQGYRVGNGPGQYQS